MKRGRKPTGLVARRRAATTRLSASEYRAAQDLAYRRGLTLSTWLRTLILAALDDDGGASKNDQPIA